MGQEFQLQPSPTRTAHQINAAVGGGFATGVWTPSLEFGSASVGMTYSVRAGRWIKIGPSVTAWLEIVLTAKGSSVGTATITGLPFNNTNSSGSSELRSFGSLHWSNMTTALVNLGILTNQGTNGLVLVAAAAAATGLNVIAETDFADTSVLIGNVTYQTDD